MLPHSSLRLQPPATSSPNARHVPLLYKTSHVGLYLFQVRHAHISYDCTFRLDIRIRGRKFREMCIGGTQLDCPEQSGDWGCRLWLGNGCIQQKGENLKCYPPIFLFMAFYKTGTILRITQNFTLALKPETAYVRRDITEHLGRHSTSALLFYRRFPLQSLIYDLCRNPHLNPNLAFNHAVLTCS